MVNTEGPDGADHDYEIKYTFGVRPLQQYMVEFPDGRVQVLRESWDIENKKWFYVTPPDVTDERIEPGDPLHWTGIAQNWNTTCADCHSTNVHKNYDPAHQHISHDVRGDRRELRGMPRAGERARRPGAASGRRSGTATSATALCR